MQLEIEREALKKEKDAASKDRLAKLEKELADSEGDLATRCKAQWQAEKEAVQQVRASARTDRANQGGDRTSRAAIRPQPGPPN